MFNFYKGEVRGSVSNVPIHWFIMAKTSLEAENKLFEYWDKRLSRKHGELTFISITTISPSEYYGIKRASNTHFI